MFLGGFLGHDDRKDEVDRLVVGRLEVDGVLQAKETGRRLLQIGGQVAACSPFGGVWHRVVWKDFSADKAYKSIGKVDCCKYLIQIVLTTAQDYFSPLGVPIT